MSDTEFFLSIPKTELPSLPAAAFKGKIVVVDDQSKVADAVKDLRGHSIIGFDTETKPTFKRGQSNNMALMQLSTRDTCYLFRLNKIGMDPEVLGILEDENILKIGTSVHDDFTGLRKVASCEPANFIDLQRYVKQYRIADNSLSRISAIIFGERISKNQQKTNWEAENLTPAQQSYAALDAFACIRIYEYLESGKFCPEKSIYINYPEPETPNDTEADEK